MKRIERDRVGLGWRPEIATGIFANLAEIDVVEVIADDYFRTPKAKLDALRFLAAQRPITLHGVTAGMASTIPVEQRRLDDMARLVERLQPESWSEHLAFVRGGGHEIGHLAAPPRTKISAEATAENVHRAWKTVGAAPMMENISTLIDPPCSEMRETEWLSEIQSAAGCGLLLDLHNLYANGTNFGTDAMQMLDELRLEAVSAIHIAGGMLICEPGTTGKRILDDHKHPVPEPVYGLLTEVARRCRQPLTVILERDGAYPEMEETMKELRAAHEAMARGRMMREAKNVSATA